jgi:hypothetical protein
MIGHLQKKNLLKEQSKFMEINMIILMSNILIHKQKLL